MFEWLFNYPVSAWQGAVFAFDGRMPWPLLLASLAIVVLFITFSVWRQPISVARRTLIVGLQTLVAAILLVIFWQPTLKIEVAESGENTVAWILDASASMQTDDVKETGNSSITRFDAGVNLVENFAFDQGAEFQADLYAQAESLQAVSSVDQLSSIEPSSSTDLGNSLDEILGTVSQNAIAAVVLVSDGSNNASSIDAQWWQRLSAAGVPVHTVGMGAIRDPNDIQLSDVTLPQSAAAGLQLTATVTVSHSTAGSARLRVFSGRDLLAVQDIDLPENVQQSQHEVGVPTGELGVRQLRFEVAHNDERVDPNPTNNRQQRIVRITDTQQRILYVEGEPRWEYKFLRRALDDNPSVEIVSLLRTSPNKFYRQGVRDADELAGGFPLDRETLFAYDAIIIGSLEAAELSTKQQLALRDFVNVRGGSLLMLGGRHGLADGGWGRSVVAAALPVILDARLSAKTFDRRRAQVLPTASGYRTPWLQLGQSAQENRIAWQGLPNVADVQQLGTVKPGAVVLLEQTDPNARASEAQALLVTQRYGKGQSFVLGTSGSWRWQMGLDSTDQRHELFWTQLANHLVANVLTRIRVNSLEPVYRDVNNAEISLLAYLPDYTPLQQSSLNASLTLPDGSTRSVEFTADLQQVGRYTADVEMPIDGPYVISAQTPLGGESPRSAPSVSESWWVRESGTAESFNNTQQTEFLQRVADVTGGSYLPFDEVASILDVLSVENAALKRQVSLPLWNMPILFLGLLFAKLAEWLLRLRWRRL